MQLRRFLLIASLLSAFSPHLLAQVSGAITSSQCVSIAVTDQATVGIQVTGTWSGTLQPEISIQGQTPQNIQVTPTSSSTAQSTITANGLFQARVAGGTTFLLCGNTVASGTANVFLNATQAVSLNGIGAGTAVTVPFSGVTAGSNTNALVVGTGGTFTPTGLGQIVATQNWGIPGISAPSLSTSASGGSLPCHTFTVAVSYNNAAGETLPSVGTTTNIAGCTTATGQITVTAPTLPTGYTSYNVYSYDGNLPYQKQIANSACVAITTNCVINAIGTGSNPLTVPTAFPTPPNAQAFNGMYGEQPWIWAPQADGSYRPWVAVDWSSCATGNFSPCGTPTFLTQTFFTDYGNGVTNSNFGTPITLESGSNCMVCINHLPNFKTQAGNQDRALWISAVTPTTYSNTTHGIEGIQAEVDFNCNGCGFTAPDSELSTASFQMSDEAATNYTAGGAGTNAIRANLFKSGAGASGAGSYSVIRAEFDVGNATFPAGSSGIVNRGICSNSTGNVTNLSCYGFYFVPNTTLFNGNRPLNGTIAFYSQNVTSNTPGTGDAFARNDNHAWPTLLNGPTGLTQLVNTDMQALPVSGSATWTGSLATAKLASAQAMNATPSCSGGASTYTYAFVYKDALGGAVVSNSANATNCANPLTAGNPVTINFTANFFTLGGITNQVSSIDVYRTAGPMSTGKIGTVACNPNFLFFGCTAFVDNGIAADGGTAPSTNTTGEGSHAGYFNASGNHVQLTSDFTSAANTSLQTITGLSWNLDPTAKNYSFHCSLMYSQATAAASMQFGIQVATANPTNVSAKGRVDTSTSAQTSGVLTGLATTTATSIVTFTPSASATVFGADMDGSIEVPANDAGNVVNIMVQTSNSADLPTVKRGSYCYLY